VPSKREKAAKERKKKSVFSTQSKVLRGAYYSSEDGETGSRNHSFNSQIGRTKDPTSQKVQKTGKETCGEEGEVKIDLLGGERLNPYWDQGVQRRAKPRKCLRKRGVFRKEPGTTPFMEED